jgi:DNA-binding transcriptional LysR family regulator
LDIRFLESLVAIVETGSIAAAARRHDLTPAAVSQRIQALERHFRCALLLRSAHAVQPTEACLALLPRIRLLIRETHSLTGDLDTSGLSGELRIGAISTALTGILPQALGQMSKQAPNIRLKIVPGSSHVLYEGVLSGELDGAVLVEPPFVVPKSLKVRRLRAEKLLLLSRYPVGKGQVDAAINSAPYIRYDPNAWGGRIAERYIADRKLQPEVFCDLDGLEAIAILVAQGMGNSLVPAWAGFAGHGLCVTEVSGSPSYDRHIVFLTSATPSRPKALALLGDMIEGLPDDGFVRV